MIAAPAFQAEPARTRREAGGLADPSCEPEAPATWP
jgi:hypothetical protein